MCGDGVRGSLLRTSWERGSASEAARKRSKINVFSPHLLTGGTKFNDGGTNFMKSHEEYNDKLMIKIDWLSFTVQKSMTPKGVIEYLAWI